MFTAPYDVVRQFLISIKMKKLQITQMESLQGGAVDPTGGLLCAIAIIYMASPTSTLEQVQWADSIISAYNC